MQVGLFQMTQADGASRPAGSEADKGHVALTEFDPDLSESSPAPEMGGDEAPGMAMGESDPPAPAEEAEVQGDVEPGQPENALLLSGNPGAEAALDPEPDAEGGRAGRGVMPGPALQLGGSPAAAGFPMSGGAPASGIPAMAEPGHPEVTAQQPPGEGGEAPAQVVAPAEGDGPAVAPPLQPVASSAARAPVPMDGPIESKAGLPRDVVRQVMVHVTNLDDGTLEMALSPEELGHVRITISRGERVSIVILAERAEVIDLMRRHSDMIMKELDDIGLSDGNVSFLHREDLGQSDEQRRERQGADPDESSEAATLTVPVNLPNLRNWSFTGETPTTIDIIL